MQNDQVCLASPSAYDSISYPELGTCNAERQSHHEGTKANEDHEENSLYKAFFAFFVELRVFVVKDTLNCER